MKAKNAWRVYYGTEENIFECEHEDFATLEKAQAWMRENVERDIQTSYEKVGSKITSDNVRHLADVCTSEYGADTESVTGALGEYRYVYAIGMIGKTCRQARKRIDGLRAEYKEIYF